MSDDKAHIMWFSFEGEFVCDYPTFLYGRPSQATIEAIVFCLVLSATQMVGAVVIHLFPFCVGVCRTSLVVGNVSIGGNHADIEG